MSKHEPEDMKDLMEQISRFLEENDKEVPEENDGEEQGENNHHTEKGLGRREHYDKREEFKRDVLPLLLKVVEALQKVGISFFFTTCVAISEEETSWYETSDIGPGWCEFAAMGVINKLPHDFAHNVLTQADTLMALHHFISTQLNHQEDEGDDQEEKNEEE